MSINTGAYLAEVIRGGIISTPEGQFEAASALRMTHQVETSQFSFLALLPAFGCSLMALDIN